MQGIFLPLETRQECCGILKHTDSLSLKNSKTTLALEVIKDLH